jgi:DNA-directed RNA polymerase specialized sigma24 family protein
MAASRSEGSSNAPFPTTRWSQVVAAGDPVDPAACEALAGLCAAYWYPLYAFVRRKGHPPDEAADLVQGTFVNLLDRQGLASVAPGRGRFRSYLMAVCAHHLADCRDHDRAARRGGGRAAVPFDRLAAEGRYAAEPVDGMTPERLFERRWATSLLETAVARLEAEAEAADKAALVSRLLPTLTGGRGGGPPRGPRRRAGDDRGGRQDGRVAPEEALRRDPPGGDRPHPRRPGRRRGRGPRPLRRTRPVNPRGFV